MYQRQQLDCDNKLTEAYQRKCPRCNGKGQFGLAGIKCPDCDGTGWRRMR